MILWMTPNHRLFLSFVYIISGTWVVGGWEAGGRWVGGGWMEVLPLKICHAPTLVIPEEEVKSIEGYVKLLHISSMKTRTS